jgi:hypothetical protein
MLLLALFPERLDVCKMVLQTSTALEAWLGDKPREWAQIIAVRAALRALPFMVKSEEYWMRRYALLPLRAIFIAWAARNFPANQLNAAYSASAFASVRAADAAYAEGTYGVAEDAAPRAAYAAADSAAVSITQTSAGAIRAAVRAADRAIASAHQDLFSTFGNEFWQAVSTDCNWLSKQEDTAVASQALSRHALWTVKPSNRWQENWRTVAKILNEIDSNYIAWIEWFERRILGEDSAFDIPGDTDRAADKGILIRLVDATDEGFWGKGHEYVNATLKGWIDEARARVAPPPIIAEASGIFEITGSATAELGPLPVPAQNRNAISFRADGNGRITIDASASVDQLRTDAEARDRHAEAASEAQAVLERCRGNNAAARLTQRLENYLAAIGLSIEDTKPSLLVQRGEKLRQELAAYAVPDTLLDPIADDILVDLRGWQSSHNMMVGLDPVLMAIDTAMLGPDRRPALIPPDEIKQFVHDAAQADLLAEGTEEILVEAADLAPAVPDPNDRRTNASIEMVRNLCIETFSIVLNYPIKSAVAATVISGIVSPILVGGVAAPISILSSIKAAEYLVAHRLWIEEKMGNTPTWQALFLKVADWLEKATPFKPK